MQSDIKIYEICLITWKQKLNNSGVKGIIFHYIFDTLRNTKKSNRGDPYMEKIENAMGADFFCVPKALTKVLLNLLACNLSFLHSVVIKRISYLCYSSFYRVQY